MKSDKLLRILGALVVFVSVSTATFVITRRIDNTKNVNPTGVKACVEACPDNRNILVSCDGADTDGAESGCLWDKRVETCGGKQYCCPTAGAAWTTDMSACTDEPAECEDTVWKPARNTKCVGVTFVQTSNCDATRSATGTKTDGACVVCADTAWSPDPALTCTTAKVTQTSNCGNTRQVDGTKTTGSCCTDTTWSPDPALTCTTAKVTQTSNCGNTRQVDGSKNCCVDSSWSPSTSTTCTDNKMAQTSNCGNTREVSGTKTCYPNLIVATKVYEDDSRNSEGEYFITKETSKVSRDQVVIYTMEVENTGEGSSSNMEISSTLTGQNQNFLNFVDTEDRCKFDYPTKKVSCKISYLAGGGEEKLKFRVKIDGKTPNGRVIRNTVRLTYGTKSKEASVSVLTSSKVNCNELCGSDSECSTGLTCDVFSNTCRKVACTKESSCICTVATATPTKIITTTAPTETVSPTEAEFPDDIAMTETPTVTEDVSQLPETGILDLPGTMTFGGGILLAILGILFAL